MPLKSPRPSVPLLAALALAASAPFLAACGKEDCRAKVRLGDFELSQNNYARADKLFREAWAADSAACGDVADRLETVRGLRALHERGQAPVAAP